MTNLKIFKYTLPFKDEVKIKIYKDAIILSAHCQRNEIQVWALVDTEKEYCERYFNVIGTGNPIDFDITNKIFIGTVILYQGGLVFHVFDGGEA